MANNGGQPILHSASFPGPLPVRPLSHGMQGLSSAQASRLLAAITNDSALKDYPGAYDLGELEQPFRFNLGGGPTLPEKNSTSFPRVSLNIVPNETFRFDSTEKVASPTPADTRSLSHAVLPKGIHASFETPPSLRIDSRREPYIDSRREPYIDSRREPYMADNSPHTETSSDNEPDRKTELMVSDSMQNGSPRMIKGGDAMLAKNGDSKAQRRLAQNREAARKSRLRKKAYVQQLENSRMKLNQLEQELQRARQQGVYIGGGSFSGDQNHSLGVNNMSSAIHTPGALAFDMDYSRWLEEHNRQISDLRGAIQNHTGDNELRLLVDSAIGHYDDIFRLKSIAAKADVFHLLSGMWKSPAERCFMWMGGHRPSELLKIILPQVEPLTEQQVLGICNLQQSSQQAEDALSQGMDSLQQSLAETLSTASVGAAGNVANYMGQMAIAMGKLGTFESFVRQADLLRQQTLQQLHRILTIRQSARALLVINDYFSRLRALSSLWLARPRE